MAKASTSKRQTKVTAAPNQGTVSMMSLEDFFIGCALSGILAGRAKSQHSRQDEELQDLVWGAIEAGRITYKIRSGGWRGNSQQYFPSSSTLRAGRLVCRFHQDHVQVRCWNRDHRRASIWRVGNH